MVLGGVLAYANSFDVPFQFDDRIAIVENEVLRDADNPAAIWNFFPQRFVVFLSFAWNRSVHGLEVFGFHLVNLVVHLLAGLLTYYFSYRLIGIARSARDAHTAALDERDDPFWQILGAAAVALVFTLHPIQTQAVTYIWQRTASLAALFCLAALCCHLNATQCSANRLRARRAWLGLGIVFAVLAMHTKQSAFSLPFLILLLEVTVLSGDGATKRDRLWRCAPWILTIPIIPLEGWIYGDVALGHIEEMGELTPYTYFATQIDVLWRYARLIMVPLGQNLDHHVPIRETIFELELIVRLLGILGIVATAWLLRQRCPLIAFGLLFFFLAQATESSFLPLADVMWEHRLYLPIVGVALVGASFLDIARPSPRTAVSSLFLISLTLLVLTASRNATWKSPVRLWEDVVAKSPEKFRAHDNLGVAYLDVERYAQATISFVHALALHPGHPRVLYSLGICYSEIGRPTEAETAFRVAVDLDPKITHAWRNLGVHLARQGRLRDAADELGRAIEHHPVDPSINETLLRVLLDLGDDAGARRELTRLVESEDSDNEFLNALARRCVERQRPDLLEILARRIRFAEAEAQER